MALALLLMGALGVFAPRADLAAQTAVSMPTLQPEPPLPVEVLSPYWGPAIRTWAPQIAALADSYGLDADFIAAVVKEESNGRTDGVSRVGAVGLMGVMPSGPGLEWRPSAEELMTPSVNLRWGVAILAEVVRQSGGDLAAALAAYSGGWEHVNSRVPQEYAARVLDNYGRAVAQRSDISPDIATQWTIAIEMRRGHVTSEPLLVLGEQPVSGLYTYGGHLIYDFIDEEGRAYYIKGYAVPVALTVPMAPDKMSGETGGSDELELQLQIRLGESDTKIANRNPRVILACLPSLSRLRGRISTRWFAPTYCPSWHR